MSTRLPTYWISLVVLLAALFAAGCAASFTAPAGVLPSADASMRDVRGAWVRATLSDGRIVPGELLAVGTDSLFVLTTANQLTAVPRSDVASARVEAYQNDWKGPATWAGLGAFSTLSHGFLFVATSVLWGASGLAVSQAHSREGFFRVPTHSWESLSKYARFPQGLPPGLRRSAVEFVPFQR